MLDQYLPSKVNAGPWITAYSLNRLREMDPPEFVLPICSLGTPCEQLAELGSILLPPLYHEALDETLKSALVHRISHCFPVYDSSKNSARLRVVELPIKSFPTSQSPQVLAFSVDTAVEEHGPHLPLGTDTIQSYSVLKQLASEFEGFEVHAPLDYGQLTWGLPFGFSIDVTADLLARYVSGFVNALTRWKSPSAIYVVDVHGSITHRNAIVQGLRQSDFDDWTFRWLHEPLAEFASARGDQHAGGVETALVERVSPALLDGDWWPNRIDDLACGQMSFLEAVELTPDLSRFCQQVSERRFNGIIGDIRNYHFVDAEEMFARMLGVARTDVRELLGGNVSQSSGANLW